MGNDRFALIGGAGFVGTGLARALRAGGHEVHIVDRHPPRADLLVAGVTASRNDLLLDPPSTLLAEVDDDAHIVVLAGASDPRPPQPWTLALQNVATALRLAPVVAGRRVTLLSTVQVSGLSTVQVSGHATDRGCDADTSLPWSDAELLDWVDRFGVGPDSPCRPHEVARVCREPLEVDPAGVWTYALTKRAQELVTAAHVDEAALTVLRLANVVGPGQERVVNRFVRRARSGSPLDVSTPALRSFLHVRHLARAIAADPGPGTFDLGSPPASLIDVAELVVDHLGSSSPIRPRPVPPELESGLDRAPLAGRGIEIPPVSDWLRPVIDELVGDRSAAFHPALPVVVPPRPVCPDEVVERQQAAMWSGELKHGNRWTTILERILTDGLDLGPDRRLLVTSSGTDALRVGIGATVGLATEGAVAVLPSFTFPATAEVLVQLGYRLRFVDVDEHTWTVDPVALHQVLGTEPRAALVVAVDTFGHPCDYPELRAVCRHHGVPLIADSAASLGATVDGRPIADQALVHSFSMSFAKVLSAGGAGGAVVLPAAVPLDDRHGWTRSALMTELHAVVALDQLAQLPAMVARRRDAARRYAEACLALGFRHQRTAPGVGHSWVHFVVRVPGGAEARDDLAGELDALGVGTKAYFLPLHRLSFGEGTNAEARSLPVTQRLGDEVLAIPLSSELAEEETERVIAALERAATSLTRLTPTSVSPAAEQRSPEQQRR